MRLTMAAYPELWRLHATYKLLDFPTPVYAIHCEDKNGSTEVGFNAILVIEGENRQERLMQEFHDFNPSWTETRCIMADNDLL